MSEINKRVGPNKVVQVFFYQKIIRFAAWLFGRSEYVVSIKSKVEILQNFVAFSEYINFKKFREMDLDLCLFSVLTLGDQKRLKVCWNILSLDQSYDFLTFWDHLTWIKILNFDIFEKPLALFI